MESEFNTRAREQTTRNFKLGIFRGVIVDGSFTPKILDRSNVKRSVPMPNIGIQIENLRNVR